MNKLVLPFLMIAMLTACLPQSELWTPGIATTASSPIAERTSTAITSELISTPMIMCTPPLCAIGTSEVYYCRSECPGGCGTICATYTVEMLAGDLGWGEVKGRIIDSITNEPIAGALVTCRHFSYFPRVLCAGERLTDLEGGFIFKQVFFHDTDRINLTISAPGYIEKQLDQAFFNHPSLIVDIALLPIPVPTQTP